MPISPRVVCSSITLRRLTLDVALEEIAAQGFSGIDLGALPGVCDHVPFELTDEAVTDVARTIRASGLQVRSINADLGDLNEEIGAVVQQDRDDHLQRLLDLAEQIDSPAIVLPCGSQGHDPIVDLEADLDRVAAALARANEHARARDRVIWVESQHSGRLCYDIERAAKLTERLGGSGVGLVLDFSHVVASSNDPIEWIDRFTDGIVHVHIRDAVPGNIHRTPGNGDVDFAAGLTRLAEIGYEGAFSLELETDDVANEDRPATARRVGEFISSLI